MGTLTKAILLLFTIGTSYKLYQVLRYDSTISKIETEFWGPSSKSGKPEDESIRPFKINIEDKVLEDLRDRLKREIQSADRAAPPLESIGFEYGFNSKFLKTVQNYWLEKYDWRAREKLLNQYPHYKTMVGGLDMHFQHIRGQKNKMHKYKRTLPLLMLHGWPGSFVEFQKIIPLLAEPKNSEINFELIIPSLPGYGFSSGASRTGMDTVAMSHIFLRLMKRLGHEQFYIMGGDWGALIVSDMATLYPDNVLGAHSTLCNTLHPLGHIKLMFASFFPSWFAEKSVADRLFPMSKTYSFMIRETGYFHIQATKPDTVGIGLTHSPSGLAAYILEKFSTWTNRNWIDRKDGGLLENFSMDELLDNVMIYWITNSITTSMRLYSESFNPSKKHKLDRISAKVPIGCLVLPEEIIIVPEFVIRDKFVNLTQYSVAEKGGHFGAFEVPEIVANDLLKFLSKLKLT